MLWELIFEIPMGMHCIMCEVFIFLSHHSAILLSLAFGAILQGSLFGLAGLLPASYTTPIMSGQGFAGSFAATSMICAIASVYFFYLI